jgi:hypothetical protein
VFAVVTAVKAEYAFANPDVAHWLAAAFTGLLAHSAIDAFVLILADSPDGKPADYSEQGA